jgi:phage shock protein C
MNTSASDHESNISAGSGETAEPGAAGGTGPVFDKPSGSASDSGPGPGSDSRDQASGPGAAAGSGTFAAGYGGTFGSRELCRPIHDRMLAGVAAGVADYLGIDVTIVRIVLAVLVFVGGAGVPIYLAGWLLIPEEGADASIASELVSSLENRSR